MRYETRVNLKHLLEDLRDGYGLPVEETILTELTANALDSKASKIDFFTLPNQSKFMIRDNGQGMKRKDIKEYHDIAATTKIKGKGIGFAGIGSKLSLLIAKSVITETKGGYGSRCATFWYLMKENRAPWKFIPFPGSIKGPRGTAVTIEFFNSNFPLLSADFISKIIKKHFYPLLDPKFVNSIFKYIYRKGVEFSINGKKIELEKSDPSGFSKTFQITLGKRQRRLEGFGYLAKSANGSLREFSGVGISTYGKVIKWGWDWLGILPKSPFQIQGMIEIPALAEILTTNKNDFLKDSTSLKKYYKYRKAVQEAVLPILDEIGEGRLSFESDLKRLRPLERDIEETLRYLLSHFPELTSLVGIRKKAIPEDIFFENEQTTVEILPAPMKEKEKISKEKTKEIDGSQEKKKKAPSLSIGFEKSSLADLARMVKNTILINTEHPAYQKSKKENAEEYHLLLCVAWTLSKYLEESHSPQDFMSRFLASWGFDDKRNLQFFQSS